MISKKKSFKEKRKVVNVSGMRATSQRAIILEVIRQGHLDADEIYRQAREKQPRLSLSTVYRTLQMLKKRGLVEELHLDETHHHYEVKTPSEHHHIVCLDCGKVVEFDCPFSLRMKKDVARKSDFEINGVEIRMTGYCSRCQQKRK